MSLPTQYQQFIHISRYARWNEAEGRRETWEETVARWAAFWQAQLIGKHNFLPKDAITTVSVIAEAIQNLDVMPSMRGLMTAGKALDRDHAAGYNCAYVAIDDPIAFAEIMYLLSCGCGVGFSVERQSIKEMPTVAETFHDCETVLVVADSKIGWAASFRQLLALLYVGQVPKWDVSKVRARGERLKTFGGRASGPDPLVDLFKMCVHVFKGAAGRKLTSLECHDLVCKIGQVIVSGGVRRSALISLSNLSDDRMRNAKNGAWFETASHRQLANNSAAYTEKPDFEVYFQELLTLYQSRAGERGIFSRVAAQKKAAENGRRDAEREFGTNPCGEIILRSCGFCNLSEVVVRPEDTLDQLKWKVAIAARIGTLQSTLTDFRFLRKIWQTNAQEERLLGVSLTGILDHPVMGSTSCVVSDLGEGKPVQNPSGWLEELKQVAIDENKYMAELLGVPASVAITTVKPSGTVSQLVDSSSGIHPRYAPFYIRRVTQDKKDPVTHMMIAKGVPYQQNISNENTVCFEFPMKSPSTSRLRNEVGAIQQLELYKLYRDNWCEHNPSTTIYYKDSDFFLLAQWTWDNFDGVGGVAFLPHSDHAYDQAPYEEIDEAEFNKRLTAMPILNWDDMRDYEKSDQTEPHAEPACAGGHCDVI